MSYFIVFGTPDSDEPIDGDDIASNTGWAAFGEWASQLGEDYPELAYLGEHGEVFTAEGEEGDALATLEDDLRRALVDKPDQPSRSVLGVAKKLLRQLQQRPEGAGWVCVTDGTEGEQDD
jgi:hypothetical protein